ncbi:MAG: hypothetical protein IVW57_12855 [Ktedonobacterales bacterium]|nr:hypothetical protein [Ktedonobacterales bacterium]
MFTNFATGAAHAQSAEALRAALAATPGVDDWRIELVGEREAQLYLIGAQVEARRTVATSRARVTLYHDHAPHADAGGTARGSASLTLSGDEVAEAALVTARLRAVVEMAGLIDNPPFALPGQPVGGFSAVSVADAALLSGDLEAALEVARARLEAAVAAQRDVRLASAELYVTRGTRALENSQGLRGAYDETSVYLDLVLIASDGAGEAEFQTELRRRRLEDLSLERAVAAYATFARDALRATAPATYHGPVVLSGGALPSLFAPLVAHSSARAAYQRVSRFVPGASISEEPPRGDRLTLSGNPLRPFGVASAPFDDDGLPARGTPVIADGHLRGYWADARYAAYQGVPATGAFGNVTIMPGTTPLATLRAAGETPVIEVVAFSWLRPDDLSGAFVAEIKLGYRHEPGGRSVPIKGGSLSGNLFTALSDARLSAETYADGSYFGPAAIRFGALTLAGV